MITLTPDEARQRLVSWLALAQPVLPTGRDGVLALLDRLRHIQLDPLDPIGTNADLVALARVDGLARGDVARHLGPDATGASASFEHFAKVRCILPASSFPAYRDHMPTVVWWKHDREKRLPPGALEAALEVVRERGPVAAQDLPDLGAVEAVDWSGWKGTAKAATMALEVLWQRCAVVVSGKDPSGRRLHDVPSRAFPAQHAAPSPGPFLPWATTRRAEAAGLLSTALGPCWSTIRSARDDGTVDALERSGILVRLRVSGSSREYLAPAAFLDEPALEPDDRLRILGPLDPLLWDRKLIAHAFGFDYVWEVYKPAAQRRWGWYVVPLLLRGRLVGRLEARIEDDALRILNRWWEPGESHEPALAEAVERHARACGVPRVRYRRGARRRR